MNMRLAVVATIAASLPLSAQSAAEHIALGDKEHAAGRAFESLKHYEAAIAADSRSGEALWRAASAVVDIGEFDDVRRDSLYKVAEQFARRAVEASPNSAMTHFALAKAVGRYALTLGARERVKYAGEVRKEALESIRLDSINPGALHVMGMWNANVMRLNGFSRFLAKNLLGGKTFGEASWEHAARSLEKASALEPDRIVHALDLATVYRDMGDKVKAKELYQRALSLQAVDYNDPHYQKQAAGEMAKLKP
jgi:tetratricopeptide (TPR) repeat protein